ncbi:MAG TPA: hypothetical protein VJN68_12095 [Burkholderiaceae bacterium]|nr:hypothetical protein [Burkholderiaceae bacterium]
MHPPISSALRRRNLLFAGCALALAGCALPPDAAALGRSVSVDIVDRDTGQLLEVYQHAGRSYVAGRPGARYAIRISNRSAVRVLAVTAVDGINILTGKTAAWGQSGYVFEPWQTYEVTGWRKSDSQVAAFEFTSLPDSYAARTGRPLDVGVIGVAVFRERQPAWRDRRPIGSADERDGERERRLAEPRSEAAKDAAGSSSAGRADSAAPPPSTESKVAAQPDRLGTGHGQREDSWVTSTPFDRASSTPDEIVSVQYDRYENLLAAGIVRGLPIARPRPFPGSREAYGYVPDPPARY